MIAGIASVSFRGLKLTTILENPVLLLSMLETMQQNSLKITTPDTSPLAHAHAIKVFLHVRVIAVEYSPTHTRLSSDLIL